MNTDIRNEIDRLILVHDRVLIKPTKEEDTTKSGIIIPSHISNQQITTGYVVKVGKGYPVYKEADGAIPGREENKDYVSLEAQEADLAYFDPRKATEVLFDDEKYFVINYGDILMLFRDEIIDD